MQDFLEDGLPQMQQTAKVSQNLELSKVNYQAFHNAFCPIYCISFKDWGRAKIVLDSWGYAWAGQKSVPSTQGLPGSKVSSKWSFKSLVNEDNYSLEFEQVVYNLPRLCKEKDCNDKLLPLVIVSKYSKSRQILAKLLKRLNFSKVPTQFY